MRFCKKKGFRKSFGKKGQAEMIGLVIIVLMITLGMLFLAKFALQKEPDDKVFTRKGLAYSSMSAILKTELSCEEAGSSTLKILSVGTELIDDCAKNQDKYVSDNRCIGENGNVMHSCDFMQENIEMMLNETLGSWYKNYKFSSKLLQDEAITLVEVDNGGCATSSNVDSSGLFPIFVTNIGLVENVLYVCD